MVCKEDVLQWFRELESYDRIDLMHELLYMCLPFEVRFLGSCVEEVGKHSYQELRGPSIIANDVDRLSKDAAQLGSGVLERVCRHRMCIYLALLENRNSLCAHWYFKQVFRTEQWNEPAMTQKCIDDSAVLNELLMLFTLGRLHPAFNYHQKEFFSDVLEKLHRIREKKNHAAKTVAAVSMPNYPPGFGYPNQVPLFLYAYEQPPAVQSTVDGGLCPVHVKTTTSITTQTSTASSPGGGGGNGTPPPLPPPGHQQAPQHFQPYEICGIWRQQPMYQIHDPQMMGPPPQPVSPIVSHSVSPPHSRPVSPAPSNHSTSSLPPLQPPPHHHSQQHSRSHTTSLSLRGSKSSSLDSQQQQQSVRMPNATIYVTGSSAHGGGQSEVKIGDCESHQIMTSTDDKPPCNNSQQQQPPQNTLLHQDWGNRSIPLHSAPPHYATFGPHHQMPQHNAQPPNGLRQCFTTNVYHLQQQHMSIDQQQQAMFGYELDYQQQQQLNDIQLDNTLHRSGSSSNNSSNASSLNQSPPDTPASTPTPALHGPGRGNRDGACMSGVTEKLNSVRVLNNVNSLQFLTAPPPPISDGGAGLPPQQQPFSYVPYTGLGERRQQMFTRIPPFPHTFQSQQLPPSPLAPHHQQQAAHMVQGGPLSYIAIGTPTYVMPPLINSNGNNPPATHHSTNSNANIGTGQRSHHHHHNPHHSHNNHHRHHQQQQQQQHQHHSSSASVAPTTPTITSITSSTSAATNQLLHTSSSGSTCCCNCGRSEHSDAECTAIPHIDDIVTQTRYTLDYEDAAVGCGTVLAAGQQQQLQSGQGVVAVAVGGPTTPLNATAGAGRYGQRARLPDI